MSTSQGRRIRRAIARLKSKADASALKKAKDIERRTGIMPVNNPEIIAIVEQQQQPKAGPEKRKRDGPREVPA